MIDGINYTALARPGVSIRLWPAEGQVPKEPKTPTAVSFASRMSHAETQSDPSSSISGVKTVEFSLIDWGSVLQVDTIQTLAGHGITPAYPDGVAALPTMLFIGDSITSGFIHSSPNSDHQLYCGFLDAYPYHLRTMLSPGVRLYAVAFPGIKLVDSPEQEGMESKWFKNGPIDGGLDWEFDERDRETGPTHIIVNLGANDDVTNDKFLETYENFLDLLKETHGRRTGDILVAPPFGLWNPDGAKYVSGYPEIRGMVRKVKKRWEANTPWDSGTLPTTPMLEQLKFHYNSTNATLGSLPGFLSHPLARTRTTSIDKVVIGNNGLPVENSHLDPSAPLRPTLVVRPSSVAAVEPTARGTKAQLHFVDTEGWLDARSDTFDGLHPTRQGAIKIAQHFRHWLASNGFLKE